MMIATIQEFGIPLQGNNINTVREFNMCFRFSILNTVLFYSYDASSTFGSNQKQGEEEPEEKLNIFSVASGHLYERFLRIMMLSVLEHTKTPVKFWFLKNYLSPTFKDFLPHMANEYGFEYELVQYKWPRWLHQQTEKQRIIWGYKILFLDVLFPLDVKKFIFVDADQVIMYLQYLLLIELCVSN